MRKITLPVALAAAVLAGSVPAAAHEMWLAAQSGRVELLYGHPGDLSQPDKGRLYELNALSGGKTAPLRDQAAVANGRLSAPLPKEASVVGARLDNGFWVKTAQGYRNTHRVNIPDNLSSVRSEKFAKLLLSDDGATKPLGHRFELVPQADPFRLKPGEPLKVRVEYEGKPQAGAKVEVSDGKTEPETPRVVAADDRGIVSVELLPGTTVLLAEYKGPGRYPELAAEDVAVASLTIQRP